MGRFFEFIPKPSETYQKPANTGKNSSRDASSKRRWLELESELFDNRIADKPITVTLIKLAKSNNVAIDWEITNSNETFDPLNPERSQNRSLALIERNLKDREKKKV